MEELVILIRHFCEDVVTEKLKSGKLESVCSSEGKILFKWMSLEEMCVKQFRILLLIICGSSKNHDITILSDDHVAQLWNCVKNINRTQKAITTDIENRIEKNKWKNPKVRNTLIHCAAEYYDWHLDAKRGTFYRIRRRSAILHHFYIMGKNRARGVHSSSNSNVSNRKEVLSDIYRDIEEKGLLEMPTKVRNSLKHFEELFLMRKAKMYGPESVFLDENQHYTPESMKTYKNDLLVLNFFCNYLRPIKNTTRLAKNKKSKEKEMFILRDYISMDSDIMSCIGKVSSILEDNRTQKNKKNSVTRLKTYRAGENKFSVSNTTTTTQHLGPDIILSSAQSVALVDGASSSKEKRVSAELDQTDQFNIYSPDEMLQLLSISKNDINWFETSIQIRIAATMVACLSRMMWENGSRIANGTIRDAINQALEILGSDYRMETKDVSSWRRFSCNVLVKRPEKKKTMICYDRKRADIGKTMFDEDMKIFGYCAQFASSAVERKAREAEEKQKETESDIDEETDLFGKPYHPTFETSKESEKEEEDAGDDVFISD